MDVQINMILKQEEIKEQMDDITRAEIILKPFLDDFKKECERITKINTSNVLMNSANGLDFAINFSNLMAAYKNLSIGFEKAIPFYNKYFHENKDL